MYITMSSDHDEDPPTVAALRGATTWMDCPLGLDFGNLLGVAGELPARGAAEFHLEGRDEGALGAYWGSQVEGVIPLMLLDRDVCYNPGRPPTKGQQPKMKSTRLATQAVNHAACMKIKKVKL